MKGKDRCFGCRLFLGARESGACMLVLLELLEYQTCDRGLDIRFFFKLPKPAYIV